MKFLSAAISRSYLLLLGSLLSLSAQAHSGHGLEIVHSHGEWALLALAIAVAILIARPRLQAIKSTKRTQR